MPTVFSVPPAFPPSRLRNATEVSVEATSFAAVRGLVRSGAPLLPLPPCSLVRSKRHPPRPPRAATSMEVHSSKRNCTFCQLVIVDE